MPPEYSEGRTHGFLQSEFVAPARYTMLNDSANFLMLLFCKRINTVQKSCYAARRGIGHLPYKLLSHRSVKKIAQPLNPSRCVTRQAKPGQRQID